MATILDAILDFGPLECEEKLAPYFFLKTYNIFFQNQLTFCFYEKNDTKSQMSLHYKEWVSAKPILEGRKHFSQSVKPSYGFCRCFKTW